MEFLKNYIDDQLLQRMRREEEKNSAPAKAP